MIWRSGRARRGFKATRLRSQMSFWQHFRKAKGGNVAILFGLSAVPMVIVVGSAVDYSLAVADRTQLQKGTDAAALAGIKAIRQGAKLTDTGPLMTAMVQTNDLNPTAQIQTATLSSDGSTLCVTSVATVTTAFMKIVNVPTISVGAQACAKLNLDTYEIAFAFDNSGSMADSALNGQTKMQAAQSAANGLISALSPSGGASASSTASYSVVPFAAAVNIGSQYAGASFMDTTGRGSIAFQHFQRPSGGTNPTSRFQMLSWLSTSWAGCVEARISPYTTSDDPAVDGDTLYEPYLSPDETDGNSSSLNDYLPDEQSPNCKVNDVYYKADQKFGTGDGQTKVCKYHQRPSGNSRFANQNGSTIPGGPNLLCSTNALTTLNATSSVATKSINAMTPNGDTNLLEGMMWAWRTISPNGPFNTQANVAGSGPQNAKVYNYVSSTGAVNHKVIILLTDGENHWFGMAGDAGASSTPNKSVYSSLGYFADSRLGATNANNARTNMDNATLQACGNAMAAGIEIYTVGFTASDGIDAPGQSLLQSCATQGGQHSFIAADGDALVADFQQIASSISRPRVSQ